MHPASLARWDDLVHLFGPRGACAGCWCQWARKRGADFRRDAGAANRRSLRRLVAAGGPVGLLAYLDGTPVGWCAVAPREDYVRLAGSRVLAPVDERAVWSAPCFFVAKDARGRGVTVALLRAAAKYAASHGADTLEGYPLDTHGTRSPAAFAWWGLAPAFEKAGFREVTRRSRTRPIMRKRLRPARKARGG
ncbi:MAG: GNAT family N-acetyltransferase [Candidatus Eisenbacteria bacterium]